MTDQKGQFLRPIIKKIYDRILIRIITKKVTKLKIFWIQMDEQKIQQS